MKNRLSSVEKIRLQLLPVFKKYNVKQAILFGSYAKGEERENSDVDIMVDSNLKGLAFASSILPIPAFVIFSMSFHIKFLLISFTIVVQLHQNVKKTKWKEIER